MKRLLLPVLALSPLLALAQGPSKAVPELAVLSHYVGEWEIAMTSKGPFTGGKAKGEWILDGRYLQQTVMLQIGPGPNRLLVRNLTTWDPGRKAFRTWSFMNNGNATVSMGQWDPKQKTMTHVMRDAKGGSSTTLADFSTPGKEAWTITQADPQGQPVSRISGVSTRK